MSGDARNERYGILLPSRTAVTPSSLETRNSTVMRFDLLNHEATADRLRVFTSRVVPGSMNGVRSRSSLLIQYSRNCWYSSPGAIIYHSTKLTTCTPCASKAASLMASPFLRNRNKQQALHGFSEAASSTGTRSSSSVAMARTIGSPSQ